MMNSYEATFYTKLTELSSYIDKQYSDILSRAQDIVAQNLLISFKSFVKKIESHVDKEQLLDNINQTLNLTTKFLNEIKSTEEFQDFDLAKWEQNLEEEYKSHYKSLSNDKNQLLLKDAQGNVEFLESCSSDFQSIIKKIHEGCANYLDNLHKKIEARQISLENNVKEQGEKDLQELIEIFVNNIENIEENKIIPLSIIIKKQKAENNPKFNLSAAEFKKQLDQNDISLSSDILDKIIFKNNEIDKVGGNIKLRLWSGVLNKMTEKITPKYQKYIEKEFLTEAFPNFKNDLEKLVLSKKADEKDESQIFEFFDFLNKTKNILSFTPIPQIKEYARILLKAINKLKENGSTIVFESEKSLNFIQEDHGIASPQLFPNLLEDHRVNGLLEIKIKDCELEIVKFIRTAFHQLSEDMEIAFDQEKLHDKKLQLLDTFSKGFNKGTTIKDIRKFIETSNNPYLLKSQSKLLFTDKIKECTVNTSVPVVEAFNQLVLTKINSLNDRFKMNAEEVQNDKDKALLIKIMDDFISSLEAISKQSGNGSKEALKILNDSYFTKSNVSELKTVGESAERLIKALTDNKLGFKLQDKDKAVQLISRKIEVPLIIKDKMRELGSKIELSIEQIENNESNAIKNKKSEFVKAMNGLVEDVIKEVNSVKEDQAKTAGQKLTVIQGLKKGYSSMCGQITISDIAQIVKKETAFNTQTKAKFNSFSELDRIDVRKNLSDILRNLSNLKLEELEVIYENVQRQEELENVLSDLIQIVNNNLTNEDTIVKVINKIEFSKKLFQLEFKTTPKISDFAKSLFQAIDNYGYNKNELASVKTILGGMKSYNTIDLSGTMQNKLKAQVALLDENKQWYNVLRILHKELNSEKMEVMNSYGEYCEIVGLSIFDLLTKFIVNNDKVNNSGIKIFIKGLNLNDRQISELTKLKSSIFAWSEYSGTTSSETSGDTLTITGDSIKLGNILPEIDANIKHVYINACSTIIFYEDCNKPGVHFNIVAPNWYVPDDCTINLSGKNGIDYAKRPAAGGTNPDGTGSDGTYGWGGRYGENGGNFYGKCAKIFNKDKLKIISNGGHGGKGEDGGDGAPGRVGVGAPVGPLYTNNKDEKSIKAGATYTTVNTDFGFYKAWSREVKIYKLDGINGGRGGNGGEGGKGGAYGLSGTMKLVDYNDNSLSIEHEAKSGNRGPDGAGGRPGAGGYNGYCTKSAWDTYDKFWIDDFAKICGGHNWGGGHSYTFEGNAPSGAPGTTGTKEPSGDSSDKIISISEYDVKKQYLEACKKYLYNQGDNIFTKILATSIEESLQINLFGQGTDNTEEDFGYHTFFNKYYSEGIDSILPLRIKDALGDSIKEGKVKTLPAKYLFSEHLPEMDNYGAYNLKALAEDARELLTYNTEVTTLLVPLNLNFEHWVGMVFVIDKEQQKLQVKYFDPENKPISSLFLKTLQSSLANACNDIFIDIEQMLTEKQLSNNCGSEVIENFIQYLTGYRISQEEAVSTHSLLFEASLLGGDDLTC